MISEQVILVHGTGATAPKPEGDAWWQDAGGLWAQLSAMGLSPSAFIWSGSNDEKARRKAGNDLYLLLKRLLESGHKVHLIGHSHGGSVIWCAIKQFTQAENDLAQGILSWTSVGTPFLKYGPRWSSLFRLVLTVAACAAVIAVGTMPLHGIEPARAWEAQRWWTLGWAILLAAPVLALVISAWAIWPYLKQGIRRLRNRGSKFDEQRYLCLWSSQDEAIIGLGASGSFSARVLKGEDTGDGVFRWLRHLLHPLVTATNQFVNNAVSRALQGSSVPDIELKAALPHPHRSAAQHVLPKETDARLISNANEKSGLLGKRVRELLVSGRHPVTGFSDLEKNAIKAFTYRELVHTSYFLESDCVEIILHHVASHSMCAKGKQLPEALSAWYEGRSTGVVPAPALDDLPSNSVGYAVLAQSTAILVVAALAAISLPAAFEKALAPTSPGYHFGYLVNEELLAAALTAPAVPEQKSQLLWRQNLPPMPPSSSLLKNYIEAITLADQLPLLQKAFRRLEFEGLKAAFYKDAMPVVGNFAGPQQIEWLLDPANGLLPGPAGTVDGDLPALQDFMGRVFQRNPGELNDKAYGLAIALCHEQARCKGQLSMLRAASAAAAKRVYDMEPMIDISAIRSNLKRASASELFYGPDGFLALFSHAAQQAGEPDEITAKREETLGTAFWRAICSRDRGVGSYVNGLPDRAAIATALASLGYAPASGGSSKRLPSKLAMALELLEGSRTCLGQAADPGQEEELGIDAYAIAFETSKCISGSLRGCGSLSMSLERRNLMPDLAGLRPDTRARLHARAISIQEILPHLPSDAEVLTATSADAENFALFRRTRFFRVALCLSEARQQELASKFENLGLNSARLQRKYADPDDLVDIQIAETLFYGSRRDWKKASETCTSCDPRRRVQVSTRVFSLFVDYANNSLFKSQSACEPFDTNIRKFQELYAEQSAIEKRLHDSATLRNIRFR